MRNLDRDRRPVFVAHPTGMRPKMDSQGRLTGDYDTSFSTPLKYMPTVTIGHGYAWHYPYGLRINYDRVVRLDDPNWDVDELDVMWIDRFWADEKGLGASDGGEFDSGDGEYASGADLDGGTFDDWEGGVDADGGVFSLTPTADFDYIVKKVGRGKGYTILYVERVSS